MTQEDRRQHQKPEEKAEEGDLEGMHPVGQMADNGVQSGEGKG